ncbi:MAG: pyridoxal 5'-phosphate synthase glutaminase subunit PdxT [Thermotogota bacterium]|nr:pyridoxal 5'-phosphate synthase glutaminase subunit PdxT [Thermotogota bacterium]
MLSNYVPEKPIGILSMQGAIEEHEQMLKSMGVKALRVKTPKHLELISGLIFPGGESTTMIRLLRFTELIEPLNYWIKERCLPVLATCAGMILLSSKIENYPNQQTLRLLDIQVIRNAFGRQIDSFEDPINILNYDHPFNAVFIRAPVVSALGKNIEPLAKHGDLVVMVKDKNIVACSFHPELTGDTSIHQEFLKRVEKWENSQNLEARCS